ncbi:MAG: hypothetical protein ACI9DF_005968 [Verrucomicrobiales bacterium]|jgi:hypothetical protein
MIASFRPLPFLAVAVLSMATIGHAQEAPEVREFKSKSGSKLKAMIIGMDDTGKALLQPYKPNAVPMNSLSKEDQVYIKEWKERQAKEKEWVRQGWLNEQYQDPGITILKDSMRTLEKDKWKPYEPQNIENLKIIAYYFTKEAREDKFISQVSETYKKLRKRTDVMEVVYVTLGASDKAVRDYVRSKELEFPVLDPSMMGLLRRDVVQSLFKGTYPQLVVIDRKANLLADSAPKKDERSKSTETLETFEKLVRAAMRDEKNPPKEEE